MGYGYAGNGWSYVYEPEVEEKKPDGSDQVEENRSKYHKCEYVNVSFNFIILACKFCGDKHPDYW